MHKCQNMKLGKYDSLPIHVLQQFVEGVLNVHCVIFIWLLTFIRIKFVAKFTEFEIYCGGFSSISQPLGQILMEHKV